MYLDLYRKNGPACGDELAFSVLELVFLRPMPLYHVDAVFAALFLI